MTKPRLFELEISPACARVFIVLDHKGVDHEVVPIDITQKERPEEFKKVSPYGKVPVWQEDGLVIFESTVINEYIEETHPEPPMLPSEPAQRAYARQWIKYADSQLQERDAQFTHVLRDIDAKQKMCRELLEMVPMLEDELKGKSSKYFLGDDLSLVDATMAPTLRFLPVWSAIIGDKIWPTCKAAQGYLERLSEHPSVQKRAFAPPIDVFEGFFGAVLTEGLTVP